MGKRNGKLFFCYLDPHFVVSGKWNIFCCSVCFCPRWLNGILFNLFGYVCVVCMWRVRICLHLLSYIFEFSCVFSHLNRMSHCLNIMVRFCFMLCGSYRISIWVTYANGGIIKKNRRKNPNSFRVSGCIAQRFPLQVHFIIRNELVRFTAKHTYTQTEKQTFEIF